MPIAKSLAIKVRHVSSHLPSACKHGVLGDAVAARATGRANAAVAILFESVVFVLISAIPYFRGHGQSVVSLPAL